MTTPTPPSSPKMPEHRPPTALQQDSGQLDASQHARGQQEGQQEAPHPVHVCVVTGLSGAGKSTALHVFEDLGYFTVDGLPGSLVPEMVAVMRRSSMAHFKGIALGMDLRRSGFAEDISKAMQTLKAEGIRPQIFFLEAQPTELMRRYATTRRPHPLEREGMGLEAALAVEAQRLLPMRNMSDIVLDTTRFSIHQLRQAIQHRWSGADKRMRTLKVNVMSFGFKYGVPKEADMVFDLRFLPNPYFVEALRPLSGQDKAVADYVFAEGTSKEFLARLTDFLFFCLPLMEAEGRYRVTLALGCTGGRHRSVATAEHLYRVLHQSDYPVALEHRHLELG